MNNQGEPINNTDRVFDLPFGRVTNGYGAYHGLSPSEIKGKCNRLRITYLSHFRHFFYTLCPINNRYYVELNTPQLILAREIKSQLDDRHRNKNVRVLVLKARQQGISTFSHAYLLYYALLYNRGVSAVTIAPHQTDANKFFAHMQNMFTDKMLMVLNAIQPKAEVETCNNAQLAIKFADGIRSTIESAWAQSSVRSRGSSYSAIHITEVDYIDNWREFWETKLSPALRPTPKGSLVLLESTSNGKKNLYDMYTRALAKQSEFNVVFIPWYKTSEYRKELPEGYELSQYEKRLLERYPINKEQAHWYYTKVQNYSEESVLREYPSTPEDCFSTSNKHTVISFTDLEAAVCDRQQHPNGPNRFDLILGIDPAYSGDAIGLVWRQGREVKRISTLEAKGNIRQNVDEIMLQIAALPPDKIFIDNGAIGPAVYDLLKQHSGISGYYITPSKLIPINFGMSPDDASAFLNKRAEMYYRLSVWLRNGPVYITNESLEERRGLIEELSWQEWDPTSIKRKLQSKSKQPHSPNRADALALTFAEINSQDNIPRSALENLDERRFYSDQRKLVSSRLLS